jgi:signal transduction histidine kinase
MLSPRIKSYLWASRYLSNFTLPQVQNFAIVILLLFTLIFAYLLIHEEYHRYEEQLHQEHEHFVSTQQQDIEQTSRQITLLMEHELQHNDQDTDLSLKRIADIVSMDKNRFLQLFNNHSMPLFTSTNINTRIDSIRSLEPGTILELEVEKAQQKHSILVNVIRLSNGYTILSGIYTKPSELLLQERYKKSKSRLVKVVLEISTLAFILFGVMIGINKIVNAIMQRDIDTFLTFFERAAHHNDQVINYKQIFFKEFRTMVMYANEMLETIMHQKASLSQLNTSLEQKVQNKTQALQDNYEELKKAQQFSQDLLDSQKHFLRHAIHETNTPLSVIVTNIDLFTMKHGKDKQLSKIDAAVKNIFNIYDDLSYLVKKDQVEYPRAAINLNTYLQSRKEFFEEVAEQSRLSFVFTPCEGEHYVYFNETKLQRIIDNNITNAIKYTLPSEQIHIQTHLKGTHIHFEIYSRSKKIEDINKVLEPYYRENKEMDGFGLGLNLVKSICDEEGVAITIDSSDDVTRFSYRFTVMGV